MKKVEKINGDVNFDLSPRRIYDHLGQVSEDIIGNNIFLEDSMYPWEWDLGRHTIQRGKNQKYIYLLKWERHRKEYTRAYRRITPVRGYIRKLRSKYGFALYDLFRTEKNRQVWYKFEKSGGSWVKGDIKTQVKLRQSLWASFIPKERKIKTIIYSEEMFMSEIMLQVQTSPEFPIAVKIGPGTFKIQNAEQGKFFSLGIMAYLSAIEEREKWK